MLNRSLLHEYAKRLVARLDALKVLPALAVLVMLAGAAFRTVLFLYPRGLFGDESMLGLNIMERGYLGLLQPLDLNQAAPVGFLWLLKTATLVFGPTELALRFFPWLASIAALPLFFLFVREVLGVRCALVAVALLGLSPTAIDYAGEAKQYSFDLLCSVIVLLAVAFHERGTRPVAARALLAIAGSLTLLFSHAVIFVTAGAGLALLGRELLLRRWEGLRLLAPVGAIVLAAAVADYFVLLKPVLANEHLVTYWEKSLPRFGSHAWFRALRGRSLGLFEGMFGLHLVGVGVASLVLGLAGFAVRGRSFWLAVVLLPLLFLIGAASVDAYPYSDRLVLFCIPLIAVGMAAGAEALIDTRWRPVRWAGWLIVYLLLGETVRHLNDEEDFLRPHRVQQLRPVLAYVSERLDPGDVLYVNGLAMSTFRFYTEWTPDYPEFAAYERIYGPHQNLYPATPEEIVRRLRGHSRVWVIFTKTNQELQDLVDLLLASGRRLGSYIEEDSGAMLFDLGPESQLAPGPPVSPRQIPPGR